MAKADLIKDAEARGLTLTGDETVDDLKALLEAAGESEEDVDQEAKEPDAVPGKELYVEGTDSSLTKLPMPEDWQGVYQRRLDRSGVNYEHVSEGPNGVWVYRRM